MEDLTINKLEKIKNKKKDNKIVLPVYFKLKNAEREQLTVFPFYNRLKKADSTGNEMITPFYWHLVKKNKEQFIFFPIVWNSKTKLGDDIIVRTNILLRLSRFLKF